MDGIFKAALIIHILFGSVALFVAPAAMVTSKGGLWHRRWGKLFFWAITGVAITAVVMSLIQSGLFFLLVALFSFYLAFTGYRVLYRKTPQQRATPGDWIAVSAMLAGSVALLAYGAYLMLTSSFGMVALVFGAIGSSLRPQRHPRVSSSPGGQTGVVVQPYDENARRLYRDRNGVFRREFPLPATAHALALGDGRRNSRHHYLDAVLSKEV